MPATVEQVVDAVWARTPRTTDAGSPAASNGTKVDDIAYAIWTRSVRTVEASGMVCLPISTVGNVSQSSIGQTHILAVEQDAGPRPSVGQSAIGQTHLMGSGVVGAGIVTMTLCSVGQTNILGSSNFEVNSVTFTTCAINEPEGGYKGRKNRGRGW